MTETETCRNCHECRSVYWTALKTHRTQIFASGKKSTHIFNGSPHCHPNFTCSWSQSQNWKAQPLNKIFLLMNNKNMCDLSFGPTSKRSTVTSACELLWYFRTCGCGDFKNRIVLSVWMWPYSVDKMLCKTSSHHVWTRPIKRIEDSLTLG